MNPARFLLALPDEPGFDVTFSAPNCVSVLSGVGEERIQREVRVAHDRAVAAAFGYLERNAAVSR